MTAQLTNTKSGVTAVIYARVSSVAQMQKGHGLGSQETRCREYAINKGYTVDAVFLDDVTGGGDFMNRPGMVSLLKYLDDHAHERYVVIFDDLKRYARDTVFHLKLRQEMALRHATRECLNFKFEDSPEGEFIETVIAAQSQLERQQNSRQVRQKMRARVMNGYWVFKEPVGYRYDEQDSHGKIMVRDEPSASIIQELLEGFASSRFETQAEAKAFLESQKGFKRKNHEGKVTFQVVKEILTRPLYSGYLDYPKWGIALQPAKHEPLVSYDTFRRVQERLFGQAKAPKRMDIHQDFPLRGYVICDCCGKPMTSCWSRGRNGHYGYYLNANKDCQNYGKSIRAEKLEKEFDDLLGTMRPIPELFYMTKAMLEKLWEERRGNAVQRTGKIKAEITATTRKVEKLVERLVDTDCDTVIRTYEDEIRKLEEQKIRLIERSSQCGRSLGTFDETFRTAMEFFADPQKLWHSERIEDKRSVLKLAFEDKLAYNRNGGFRTAPKSLPFSLLEGFSTPELGMVGGEGFEPPTLSV